jgi:hypothetical protein
MQHSGMSKLKITRDRFCLWLLLYVQLQDYIVPLKIMERMTLHIQLFSDLLMMTTVSGHSMCRPSVLSSKEEMCCGDCAHKVVTVIHVLFVEEDTGYSVKSFWQ